jgi:hypothetical protein
MPMRVLILVVGVLFTAGREAAAQILRGLVRDSASGQPVSGVVVSLLDSSGALLGRIITDQAGRFNVPSAAAVGRMRTQRIGFRLRELPVRVSPAGATEVEIRIAAVPTLLEPVTVAANSACRVRSDAASTFALLLQARAGLLATVVARDANTARMRVLAFERIMDGNSDRIQSQTVHKDSAMASKSFGASRRPGQFVTNGFARYTDAEREFYAPDADVLLSDQFASGYCFRIVNAPRGRPGHVGLGFEPARGERDRVQISGTLWVDSVSRALEDLEFRYLNMGREDAVRPGGTISFAEARPGIVVIDRWSMRLPRVRADSSYLPTNNFNLTVRTWVEAVELGGELARVQWDDGVEWRGHLGTLRVKVTHPDSSVTGRWFRLDDTDYEGRVDTAGMLEIEELLPGPYVLRAVSPELAEVGMSYPTSLSFVAARDSTTEGRIVAPFLFEFAMDRCAATYKRNDRAGRRHIVLGLVMRSDGSAVANAAVKAKLFSGSEYFQTFRTGTDGRFEICVPEASRQDALSIVIDAPGFETRMVTVTAVTPVTPLPVVVGRP